MMNTSNKIVFLLFYWFYNLNRCLTVSPSLEFPSDPNQYNPVQLTNQQFSQLANPNTQQSFTGTSGDLRVFPFVVDPLIIIALIALPTIGLLGLSSLIMPLIPIAIYLIQLFFPVGGSGKRRKREVYYNMTSINENDFYDNEMQIFVTKLSKAFDKYTDL